MSTFQCWRLERMWIYLIMCNKWESVCAVKSDSLTANWKLEIKTLTFSYRKDIYNTNIFVLNYILLFLKSTELSILMTQIRCMIQRVGGVESVSYSTVFKTTEYTGCAIVQRYKMLQEYSMKVGVFYRSLWIITIRVIHSLWE